MGGFWRYHVRYRIARRIIHFGLIVWPDGPAREEVLGLLYRWRDHVLQTVEAAHN